MPDVTFLHPTPGGPSLEYDPGGGAVSVYVQVKIVSGLEVCAMVQLPTDAVVPPPVGNGNAPAGYTALAPNDIYYSNPVPVPVGHFCALEPPATANLAVTVIYRPFGGNWVQDVFRTTFKGVCTTMFVTVPATACPWFAFADDGLLGPEGEDVSTHRPVRIAIPSRANSVEFHNVSGVWRHAPTVGGTSDAGGYGGAQPLVNTGYRSASYKADEITLPAANPKVNTLVGLFQPETGKASQIFEIGTGPAARPVGVNKGIFLGLWDGRQWTGGTSNSGSVTVEVRWTPVV